MVIISSNLLGQHLVLNLLNCESCVMLQLNTYLLRTTAETDAAFCCVMFLCVKYFVFTCFMYVQLYIIY